MLGQLHIKNIGIIDEITVNFDEDLNIITGETGAGKSLIIDSINAITGSRVSKEIIRTGTDMAFVEACFFGENENTILAREIYQNGRNICKINGKMATVSELKEVGEKLIDIHGQHDNQSLLDPKTHLELLDNFAGTNLYKLKQDYTEKLEKYRELNTKIKSNYGDEQERARRLDLLAYQIDEIEIAKLKPNEEEELLARRKILMNAEKIAKSLNSSYEAINNMILDALSEVNRSLTNISDLDEKYNELLTQINDSYYNLQDASSTLSEYSSEIDFSENEQEEIEERLDLINNMKRKYGNSIEDILAYYEKVCEEKNFLENSEEIINKLKNEQQELAVKLDKIADDLSMKRKECAKNIEIKINEQMQDLEMKKAYLKFDFTKSDTYLEDGKDNVQLLICTNVGDELKPLSKIASGGEISRVMLAIKTVLGEYDSVPTMIFDEIDTGISGQAGKAVAEKLKIIGKTHQVICVTHLPSIVAAGSSNYYINKVVKNSQTRTQIKKLNEEETIKEIARVIAGDDITDAVIEHARELKNNKKK
ncbi:MAG: DNA repair protein RecN [Clostridia bacterium]|nr:DNA repair protein RecN [Clostridia bacterium]